jgi:hypothetical protein
MVTRSYFFTIILDKLILLSNYYQIGHNYYCIASKRRISNYDE